jgi:hypothetical protein
VATATNARRVLVVADQAASSLSNVVVAILVARSFATPEPFAAFGVAVMVFQFTVGCARGLVAEPMISQHSAKAEADRRRLVPSYLGAMFMFGLAVAVPVALVAMAFGGLVGSALVALAVVLPLVLIQDAWRYMLMIDRPAMALTIDLVWLAASCAAIAVAPASAEVGWYVLAWGAGGTLAALVASAVCWRCFDRRPRPIVYFREHRALGVRFLGEYAAAQAGTYVALAGCGWILGLNAYGAVRAAWLFFGPIMTLQAGILLAALPEGMRLRDRPERLLRLVIGASLLASAAAIGWTLVGVVLPDSFGQALFGPTWASADDILVPMGLAMIGASFIAGGLVGVRSLDGTKGIGARLRSIGFTVVCPLGGAVIGGLTGFVAGFAVGQALAAVVWLMTYLALRAEAEPAPAHMARTPVASGRGASGREVVDGEPAEVAVPQFLAAQRPEHAHEGQW